MSYHRILPKPGSWDNESLQIDHTQTTTNLAEFQSKDGGIHKASIWESQVDFKSEAFSRYCQYSFPAAAAANPGLLPAAITRIVEEQWRRLSPAEMERWPTWGESQNNKKRQCYTGDGSQSRVQNEDSETRSGSSADGYNSPVPNRRVRSVGEHDTYSQTLLPSLKSLSWGTNDSFAHSNDLHGMKDLTDAGPTAAAHYWEAPRLCQPQCNSMARELNRLDTHPVEAPPSSTTEGLSDQRFSSLTDAFSGEHGPETMFGLAQPSSTPQRARAYLQQRHPQSQTLTATGPTSTPEITAKLLSIFNKIGTLAYRSPPINPAFQRSGSRGPVISVDGDDAFTIKSIIDYLHSTLPIEGFRTRVFKGPEASPGHMSRRKNGPIVEYLNNILAWHPVSAQIVDYIQHPYRGLRAKTKRGDELGNGSVPASRDVGYPLPVALISRYQLTTVDAFACEIAIDDPYSQMSHQQWMESLWRGCVGPDIVVYIQDHDIPDMGPSQELVYSARLQDTLGIVIPRARGSSKEPKERVLRHVVWAIDSIVMNTRTQ
ncbi:hypothetical protein BDV38DRAFT_174608 [Aspergillus pseudotamarii]|uniref:HMG box domain-containing protein n=1 Tax=Aspergillus pseudotamarii TaxID=132259 RepID=A0A5N6T6N0_ASPPS|nr:uncharacterized protein BDV38DRAFT_174608 [Aspergillus pseudotamarii]KAE8141861.1 hypothetical protein BDV38DRAFT_174608 [Aspergillus pseudotamarii]